jgi:hypothetical protein
VSAVLHWLPAFGVTLAVEVPIWTLLLRRYLGAGRAALVGVGVNVVTHPALWFPLAASRLPVGWYYAAAGGAELAVWLVEAVLALLVIRRRRRGAADLGDVLLVSAIANLASIAAGVLLRL